jgi:hypothetical protein
MYNSCRACINARCSAGMLILRVLVLLFFVGGSSAQTCAVGQVLVSGTCTYNDPSLVLWYKFDAINHLGNSGTAGSIAGGVVLDDDNANPDVTTLINLNAIRGTASHFIDSTVFLVSLFDGVWQLSNSLTFSFWMYFTENLRWSWSVVSNDGERIEWIFNEGSNSVKLYVGWTEVNFNFNPSFNT